MPRTPTHYDYQFYFLLAKILKRVGGDDVAGSEPGAGLK
jgi:hypothetical protein